MIVLEESEKENFLSCYHKKQKKSRTIKIDRNIDDTYDYIYLLKGAVQIISHLFITGQAYYR